MAPYEILLFNSKTMLFMEQRIMYASEPKKNLRANKMEGMDAYLARSQSMRSLDMRLLGAVVNGSCCGL